MIGLLNRRAFLHSIIGNDRLSQVDHLCLTDAYFNEGEFRDDFVAHIESLMRPDERRSINSIARMIYHQQKSATQDIMPIRVHLPDQGQLIHYHMDLAIEPMSELKVAFDLDKEEKQIKEFKHEKKYGFVLICFILGFFFVGFSFQSFRLKKKSIA